MSLAYGGVHHVTDPAVHDLEYVAVGVERLRYGGVPQEPLDVLGVDVAAQLQRGAGMAQIIEPDAGGQTSGPDRVVPLGAGYSPRGTGVSSEPIISHLQLGTAFASNRISIHHHKVLC